MKITGIGFQSGATVTLGGTTVQGRFDSRGHDRTTMYLETYASPEFVDFNGNWEGGAQTGHVIFRFTIQNNTLTTVSCDSSGTMTFSPPPSVSNGEFSFSGADGVAVSGKFVSPSEAIGTINLAPCTDSDWYATKLDPATGAYTRPVSVVDPKRTLQLDREVEQEIGDQELVRFWKRSS